jgi:hypothetical protein
MPHISSGMGKRRIRQFWFLNCPCSNSCNVLICSFIIFKVAIDIRWFLNWSSFILDVISLQASQSSRWIALWSIRVCSLKACRYLLSAISSMKKVQTSQVNSQSLDYTSYDMNELCLITGTTQNYILRLLIKYSLSEVLRTSANRCCLYCYYFSETI